MVKFLLGQLICTGSVVGWGGGGGGAPRESQMLVL